MIPDDPIIEQLSPAILSPQQKQEWDENGFFVIRGALDGALLQSVTRAAEIIEERMRRARGLSANDTLEVRNVFVEDESLHPLLDYARTFPLVLELMGHDIQMATSHLIVRPPLPDDTPLSYKAIGWHADAPQIVAYDKRPAAMKIGYFLSDVSRPGSGALMVIPGSNHSTEIPRDQNGEVPPQRIHEVNAMPGDAVFFNHRTQHAVGPNCSGHARKVLYIGYNRRWLRPIDYTTMPPELLARFSPPQRQLLGDTQTQCGYYLPRAEDLPLQQWAAPEQGN